ncbi:FAD-dependent oxidoreductase [Micromonospora sp. DT4]|uniref:FAD-dependent oxidoreductase n=1 Tax=Micromonospora sp. DT4 TaxID=3393438 RepID=UPI003CEB248A
MTKYRSSPQLSRRGVLASAGAGAAAALLGAAGRPGAAEAALSGRARTRVVVIGGGIAGVAAAWLMDGHCDVTLLEAASTLGGHNATVQLDVDGRQVAVDLGAQFFGPASHPIYHKLVTSVLQLPTVPNALYNTVAQYGVPTPVMVSPSAGRPITDVLPYLPGLQAIGVVMAGAKDLETRQDWDTTVAEFVEALAIDETLKQNLVYPFVASVNGASISQAKAFSARAALALGVRPLVGDGAEQRTEYVNARDGLQAVIAALAGEFTTVTALTNSAAVGLCRDGVRYRVVDAVGRVHVAEHVVLALPPEPAAKLVAQLPGADPLVRAYRRFGYMPARIAVHRDPVYMPAASTDWSSFNILRDGDYAEASIAYQQLRGDVTLYKSWALNRRQEPKQLLAETTFRHPVITPDFIRAQSVLHGSNGRDGLWFAGSHVLDVDSQESALVTAIQVAAKLSPLSPNRRRLGTLPPSPVIP